MITHGVTSSPHGDYKHVRIKQYFKEDRARRTETTTNNTRDFEIGKRLRNLPKNGLPTAASENALIVTDSTLSGCARLRSSRVCMPERSDRDCNSSTPKRDHRITDCTEPSTLSINRSTSCAKRRNLLREKLDSFRSNLAP